MNRIAESDQKLVYIDILSDSVQQLLFRESI